ncbi:MAG: phospholipase [Dehalococcoidia bacterium]|nr:MAG: phospholipase [Dehalococcoidia bacterium]
MTSDLYHLVQQPARPLRRPPGMLVLHGWGADEQDLLGLAPLLDDRLLVVSPRAPLRLDYGYGWYRFSAESGADAAGFDEALARLADFADSLPSRYGIDPEHLFVLGFSQGAVMGTALSLARPKLFCGAILLSGRFPTAAVEGRVDGFPVFLGHGRADPLIPVREALAMERILRERGADVTVRLYDYGHEITVETLQDVNGWLAPLLPDAG